MDESIKYTNLRLVYIKAQGVYHFSEWKENAQVYVGQINAVEISIKSLQQELIELTNFSTKNDDELGMIFNSFSAFQSSLQKSIHTVTECVDKIEASNLVGMTTVIGLPE